jgi:hypothetical protein
MSIRLDTLPNVGADLIEAEIVPCSKLIMTISPPTSAVSTDGLRETMVASAIAPASCELLRSGIGCHCDLSPNSQDNAPNLTTRVAIQI